MVRWGAVAVALGLVAFLVAYAMSDNDCDEQVSAALSIPMKAVVYCEYGGPEVIKLETIEKPVPGDDEVLVRVRAASVNPLDWHYLRGTPYLMRLDAGLRKPKSTRLGVDFAGVVEAVGKNVTDLAPGDAVFGGRGGALAEYLCVRADRAIVRKPANLTYEQAAGVPIAGLTALQALRDKGHLRAGNSVLINGASGGVGTFAVQIAKAMGAEVTGVCSGRNAEMVRSLGADRVIDYTKEDFAKDAARYDVLLDNVGNRALSECRRVLVPDGRYVLIGGGGPNDHRWLGPLGRVAHVAVLSPFVSQDLGMYISSMKKEDLLSLSEMMASGKVTPVIDRTYPLSEAAAAIRYLEAGHARGKVIVTLE
jgi:NADPH:quinone reductase-like Zn-dependent oxidoreductase